MKKLSLILCAASFAATNAFAASYTLAANTTTTAVGLKAAGYFGSNTLSAVNDNTTITIDSSETAQTYVLTKLYLSGLTTSITNTNVTLNISANTLSAVSLTTSDGANSVTNIIISGTGKLISGTGRNLTAGTNASTILTISGNGVFGGTNIQMNRAIGASTTFYMTDNASVTSSGYIGIISSNSSATITMSGSSSISVQRLTGGTGVGVDWILDMSSNSSFISTTTSNAAFAFGSGADGSTTITMADSASMSGVTSFSMAVGSGSTGLLSLKNNALLTISSSISSGTGTNSITTLSMADTSTISAGNGIVLGSASGSAAVVSLSGGTIQSGAGFSLATGTNSQGVVTVSGGTLSVAGTAAIAGASGATAGIVVNSGHVQADSIILGAVSGANATLYISGGSVSATTVTVASVSGATATLSIGANGLLSATSVALNEGALAYLTSGAEVTGTVTMNSGSSTMISVVGSSSLGADAVNFGGLAMDGAVVTVDFANFTIDQAVTIALLKLTTAGSGLDTATYTAINYDNAQWTVDLSWNESGTELLANISAVPEPALSALVVGLVGLAMVARRRR